MSNWPRRVGMIGASTALGVTSAITGNLPLGVLTFAFCGVAVAYERVRGKREAEEATELAAREARQTHNRARVKQIEAARTGNLVESAKNAEQEHLIQVADLKKQEERKREERGLASAYRFFQNKERDIGSQRID
ncbi:hypothetical protein HY310_03160 [Candidatus Microgenomates bacterium]|nr:hypothetical protein [Candidatus Microgenomates bacterium]